MLSAAHFYRHSVASDPRFAANLTTCATKTAARLAEEIEDAFVDLSELGQTSDNARTTKLRLVVDTLTNELIMELKKENCAHIVEFEQETKEEISTATLKMQQVADALISNDAYITEDITVLNTVINGLVMQLEQERDVRGGKFKEMTTAEMAEQSSILRLTAYAMFHSDAYTSGDDITRLERNLEAYIKERTTDMERECGPVITEYKERLDADTTEIANKLKQEANDAIREMKLPVDITMLKQLFETVVKQEIESRITGDEEDQ